MKIANLLELVVTLWAQILGATEFKIVSYLYLAATEDGVINKSIHDIAEATGLSWRTVQSHLVDLDTRGVIEVMSVGRERTLIQIPTQHWSRPINSIKSTAEPTPARSFEPVEQPASIEELIFRLTGKRPSPDAVANMKAAAGNDELRLQHCLDSFLRQRSKRWETVNLLTVAVQYELRPRNYFDNDWSRP